MRRGMERGAGKATGDLLHMTSDDLLPDTRRWLPAALEAINQGGVPLGWVREKEAGRLAGISPVS